MREQILQWLQEENCLSRELAPGEGADWIIEARIKTGSFGADAQPVPIHIGKPTDSEERMTLQAEFETGPEILARLNAFAEGERKRILEDIYIHAAQYLPLSVYIQRDEKFSIEKLFCFDELYDPDLTKTELYRSLRTMANFYAFITNFMRLRLQLGP